VEYIRASRTSRHALVIRNPHPVASVKDIWRAAGHASSIGIFLILLGGFLYVGRALLLPIVMAAVVGMTLGPLIKAGKRYGISPWTSSILIVALAVGALALVATAIAAPVSEWIGRAHEIGTTIKHRLVVLEPPLAALHELETALFGNGAVQNAGPPSVVLPVVAFLTPAAGQLLLFFGTLLFFLGGQLELRARLVSLFESAEAKLRFLRIISDIEKNLASYLAIVTAINATLGMVVATGAWLVGLPDPVIFGMLAAFLNYVPMSDPPSRPSFYSASVW